ncbi:hypothetical protein C8D97_11243 [Pleionea mediterranea]|uniref:Uncharacterized protein n=1 Tax=Pleionea mediterranea TaxID=523701 RepID=A0A316FXK0_9GAMM|nr:hypothetical protein C8D97_11243 [Pleionea mediterranea]
MIQNLMRDNLKICLASASFAIFKMASSLLKSAYSILLRRLF